jgi:hypothetical protein
MSLRDGKVWKCRCGRETRRPEYAKGLLLCSECAFDMLYGTYKPSGGRPDPKDFIEPKFGIRKVS